MLLHRAAQHMRVLISTVTTKISCCAVCTYPKPERCPVVPIEHVPGNTSKIDFKMHMFRVTFSFIIGW